MMIDTLGEPKITTQCGYLAHPATPRFGLQG